MGSFLRAIKCVIVLVVSFFVFSIILVAIFDKDAGSLAVFLALVGSIGLTVWFFKFDKKKAEKKLLLRNAQPQLTDPVSNESIANKSPVVRPVEVEVPADSASEIPVATPPVVEAPAVETSVVEAPVDEAPSMATRPVEASAEDILKKDEVTPQPDTRKASENSISGKDAFAITEKRISKLKLEDDYEIVGLFYEGRRKLLCKHMNEVDTVYLAPEVDNPKDKNAVACYWINENAGFFERRQNLVGYIPKEQAKSLRKYFDILGITELEAKAKLWVP